MRDAAEGKITGKVGEQIAVSFLKKNGYKILEKNFRCRLGEIDIVAREGKNLVFIEVKTRKSNELGYPEEAVDLRKQRKIVAVALSYLQEKNISDKDIRFDVVAVLMTDSRPEIRLIQNAFACHEI
jgi:putative endonuclease